jgi:hypothetical protein
LRTIISALRLGDVALLLHGSELYSYFGIALRHQSPFRATIVVGFADDYIGYIADPQAFSNQEYSVSLAPKIFDLPPYQPQVGKVFTDRALQLLAELHEERR